MAKVSVIMPTYGVEKYFAECIESVINQTLKDIEIIPVNDGSPDNCGKMIDHYASLDSRIKPIHQENGGYGKAVNAGFAKATGDYIAIVETDDSIVPTMLEELYNLAVKSGANLTKGGFYHSSSSGNIIENLIPRNQEVFNLDDFPNFINNQPSIWSALYKRGWLVDNKISMLETKGASFQDILFHLKTAFYANKIALLHKPIYYYRVDNANSSVNSKTKNAMAIMPSLEAMNEILTQNPTRYQKLQYAWFYSVIHYIDWNFNRLYKNLRKDFYLAAREFITTKLPTITPTEVMTRRQINLLKALVANKSYGEFLLAYYFKKFFCIHLQHKYGGMLIRIFGVTIFEERISKRKIRYSLLFIPVYKVKL